MDVQNASYLPLNYQSVNRYLTEASLKLSTIDNSKIAFQPLSINLFNSVDLQTELQQTLISNFITLTQDSIFENFQNLQKLQFTKFIDHITTPVLALLSLDDIFQTNNRPHTNHTENISQLFNPNINYTWLNQTSTNLRRPLRQQLFHKTKPQDYQKKRKPQKNKLQNSFLGKLFAKFLKKLTKNLLEY
ncbi:MAG: hypothetical protein LBE20_02450 [Deltaproteobacteria bacterium]|jgi:hypothetical protein|nr:hypothetical protein [Deltaproteobacteria bacterium]